MHSLHLMNLLHRLLIILVCTALHCAKSAGRSRTVGASLHSCSIEHLFFAFFNQGALLFCARWLLPWLSAAAPGSVHGRAASIPSGDSPVAGTRHQHPLRGLPCGPALQAGAVPPCTWPAVFDGLWQGHIVLSERCSRPSYSPSPHSFHSSSNPLPPSPPPPFNFLCFSAQPSAASHAIPLSHDDPGMCTRGALE